MEWPWIRCQVLALRSYVSGPRTPAASYQLLATHYLPYRPLLNSLFKYLALEDPFHIHARSVDHVRIEFAGFNQVLDFSNGDLCRGRHHGIKIARSLPI